MDPELEFIQLQISSLHGWCGIMILIASSYRPGGWLGCARLLEGHVKGVGPGVVCVGWDCRWWREGIKGGAGLGVGWWGCHVVLCVVIVVGAGRGGTSILDILFHAVQEPQVCVLWLQTKWRKKGVKGATTKECLNSLHGNVMRL